MTLQETMRLLQFGDSMLPVGSFSFSNTLESAIQVGLVDDSESLRSFVRGSTHRAAISDGLGVLHAHRAASDGTISLITATDQAVFNRKLSEEMRTQTVRTGKKLVEVGIRVCGGRLLKETLEMIVEGETPGTFPVALGVCCFELGLSEQDAFAVHQYGVAMTILGASLRLMRIDHLETQTILYEANTSTESDYGYVARRELAEMSSFGPIFDILGAVHVQSHVRMFMS